MIRLRTPIQAALPCLCAFLPMGLYALELLPQLNLTAVNLICILLACLNLFPGIVNAVNTRKAECFSSSLLIAAAALAVNLRGQLPPSLSALSAWEALWAGLAAVSAVCLAVVLLRLLRWSQENWEQERANVQEWRRNRRESRRSWWRTWGQYWAQRLTARREYARNQVQRRQEYRQQIKENRRAAKLEWKTFRQARKRLKKMLEVWEWQQAWRDLTTEPAGQPDQQPRAHNQSQEPRRIRRLRIFQDVPGWGWAVIIVVSVVFVCVVAAFLIWIPTIQELSGTVENWFLAVRSIIVPLILKGRNRDPNSSPVTPEEIGTGQVLFFYLMIVILCVVILVVAVYLIATLLKRIWTGTLLQSDNKKKKNGFSFLSTYANSFSLLLVSFVALYALSSGKISVNWFANIWATLLFTILFILIMLTAFEIVRLVLEQCGQADSVLKRIIFLSFIAVLDFLSDIIFGVLKGLHIESAISSLLTLVLPGNPDEIPARTLEKIKRIFQNQIDAVNETPENSVNPYTDPAGGSPFTAHAKPGKASAHKNRFFRRKVWRRGNNP